MILAEPQAGREVPVHHGHLALGARPGLHPPGRLDEAEKEMAR